MINQYYILIFLNYIKISVDLLLNQNTYNKNNSPSLAEGIFIIIRIYHT